MTTIGPTLTTARLILRPPSEEAAMSAVKGLVDACKGINPSVGRPVTATFPRP